MYHDVLPATDASGGGPERFAVPLASFERMLDLILESGLRGCSVAEALASGGEGCVGITFDDGTRSHLEQAAPALRERGMSATFYVTTDWVGRPGNLTWDELRRMASWGMSIQSHTRSHPFLSELGPTELRAELSGSKGAIDGALGQETTELALPGGDPPPRRLRGVFAEAGYRVVATSRWGVNPHRTGPVGEGARPVLIRRCTVRGSPSEEMMRRVLAGDAWLSLRISTAERARARLKAVLGATRYARWRRSFLDALSSRTGG